MREGPSGLIVGELVQTFESNVCFDLTRQQFLFTHATSTLHGLGPVGR